MAESDLLTLLARTIINTVHREEDQAIHRPSICRRLLKTLSALDIWSNAETCELLTGHFKIKYAQIAICLFIVKKKKNTKSLVAYILPKQGNPR